MLYSYVSCRESYRLVLLPLTMYNQWSDYDINWLFHSSEPALACSMMTIMHVRSRSQPNSTEALVTQDIASTLIVHRISNPIKSMEPMFWYNFWRVDLSLKIFWCAFFIFHHTLCMGLHMYFFEFSFVHHTYLFNTYLLHFQLYFFETYTRLYGMQLIQLTDLVASYWSMWENVVHLYTLCYLHIHML